MLKALKDFLSDLTGSDESARFAGDDPRLAAAGLLVHLISVDGEVDQREQEELHRVLQQHFDLDNTQLAELIATATRRDAEAVDLYGYTSVLMRRYDEIERLRIVEMMWEMVYADGIVHEFEDNMVWRVAELLAISSRDRMTLKKRIARKHAGPDLSQTGTSGT